jgi:hypothetical protein
VLRKKFTPSDPDFVGRVEGEKLTLRLPLDSLIPKNGIRSLGVAQGKKVKSVLNTFSFLLFPLLYLRYTKELKRSSSPSFTSINLVKLTK